MNRIDQKFAYLRSINKKAFIPFITAGDPSLDVTESLALSLESSGADVIELGVPFSDPIADGPTIQRSSLRALKSGTTLKKVIDMVAKLRTKTEIPIVLMGYYNPIYKYGVKKFVSDAVSVGIDGLIVADLPPEEADELISVARGQHLDTIFLVAPTSSLERIKIICEASTGYVYCVSSMGVTGTRERISETLRPTVEKIKRQTDKPIAIGFGVSNPEQAKEVAKLADGVIVGSAIVNIIEKEQSSGNLIPALSKFSSAIARAIRSI